MRSLSVERFNQFYDENISITRFTDAIDHSISKKLFISWKQRVVDFLERGDKNELTSTLHAFFTSFAPEYISLSDFQKQVNVIVQELFNTKIAEFNPDTIIIMVNMPINKSGLWVTLLAWPVIQARSGDSNIIISAANDTSWITERLKSTNEKIATLYFDDATYSGKQYSEKTINFKLPGIVGYNSRWVHAVMIPYATERARKRIQQYAPFAGPDLWFPNTCKIMNVYGDELNLVEYPIGSVWDTIFDHQPIEGRAATYFQHKLADHISVYNFILRSAPTPISEESMAIGPSFVKNCGPQNMLTLKKDVDAYINAFSGLSDCFSPLYKSHPYTFNGVVLEKGYFTLEQITLCVACKRLDTKLFRQHGHPIENGVFCGKHCQTTFFHN